MKRCSKCGIEKAASEFNKDKSNKDGLQPRCKACEKLYKEANKERYREQSKLYREANKEQIRERKKLHYEANKEKILERQKLYKEANKEKISAYHKLYYAKESLLRDERYIAARMKNGYTREEAVILRDIYKSTKRGEQNRDACDQLFMAGLI